MAGGEKRVFGGSGEIACQEFGEGMDEDRRREGAAGEREQREEEAGRGRPVEVANFEVDVALGPFAARAKLQRYGLTIALVPTDQEG